MASEDPFKRAENEYFRLRGQLETGRITRGQFDAGLKQLVVQDVQGRWWMLGTDSGKWNVYDGTAWVEANPYPDTAKTLGMPLPRPTDLPERGHTIASTAPLQPHPQPSSVHARSPRIGKIAILAIGFIMLLLLFGAGALAILSSQGKAQIRLSNAATHTPTEVSPTGLPTLVIDLGKFPGSQPTPTQVYAIGVPTINIGGPPRWTPVPSSTPWPTPAGVTFKFDEGVSRDQRDLIQNGIALASKSFGDAGAVSVYAYADLNSLVAEADRVSQLSATSEASTTMRSYFQTGKWISVARGESIWVWVSDMWKTSLVEVRTKTLAHEYFHVVQTYQAKRSLTTTGPLWLYEGAARNAVNRAFASQGLVNLDKIYTEYVNSVHGILSPLSAFETLKAAEAEDTEAPYSLGYLAVEFLISKYGNDSLPMLVKFWEAQGTGAKWEDAFRSTFGMSVEEFYPRFEEYRRNQYPPYCGTVGAPIAQATPAPLEVRFINRRGPGIVTFWDAAWTQSPNIPYTFCVIGFPWGALANNQKSATLKLPKDNAGWYPCGGSCIILYMKPTIAAGRYTFAVELPDGRRVETTFEHKRE